MQKLQLLAFGFSITSALAIVDPGSKTDLWDISQGTVVTSDTGVWSPQISIGDMFGGTSSFPQELGQVVFADGKPPGFTHAVEWQTTSPVEIGAFALYASGDDFAANQREFASFTLKAKSPGSQTFDLTLYTYQSSHPYSFQDPSQALLISDKITPVTSQFFRAEFVQWNAGTGFDGPRVVELDGFGVPDSGSSLSLLAIGMVSVAAGRRLSRKG